MHRRWWLVGAVVLAACGSKDPESDDGPDSGRGGSSSSSGRGGNSGRGGAGSDAGPERDGGGAGGKDSGSQEGCDGPYLPMAVGNTWTYRVIDPVDGVSTKVNTIDRKEKVGGTGPNADKMAFHALTEKTSGAGEDMTESWQDVLEDGSVVRYREVAYKAGTNTVNGEEHWDPYKLRIDNAPAHIADDATWTEKYAETKIDASMPVTAQRTDGWTVEGVDVPCGPVNGEMLSCIRLRKAADGAAAGKTYWFARCVGKVREMGTQVEDLMDYELR